MANRNTPLGNLFDARKKRFLGRTRSQRSARNDRTDSHSGSIAVPVAEISAASDGVLLGGAPWCYRTAQVKRALCLRMVEELGDARNNCRSIATIAGTDPHARNRACHRAGGGFSGPLAWSWQQDRR